jgi:hypothetical protein
MKTFREVDYQAVEWAGRWKYALRSGQTVIGTIYLKEDFRAQAVAESAEGCWLFEKKWFPTERVMLRQADSPADVAVFRNTWTRKKATLEFRYGQTFYWMPTDVWRTNCIFTNAYGEPLVHFIRRSNPFAFFLVPKGESKGRVHIERSARLMNELPLLTLLGCYLMILESV